MSDHKKFLREFFSPLQYRRIVNFMRAINDLFHWWKK